ncbi:MAG: hypothetical protein ACW97Z_01185 [Candidatus Hodarchaeales archaeon]|jgi:hypothetical protein
MDFTSLLNVYCRKIGIWFLSLVPVVLSISLMLLAFSQSPEAGLDQDLRTMTTLLYIVLILIALPFSLNGFLMERAFNAEINRIISTGLLIRGVEGFDEVHNKIKLLYRASYSITASVLISYLVFTSASLITSNENDPDLAIFARFFIFVASIGLLAISSGASILLRLPNKSAIQPGGLMKYYSPRSLPLKLDNLLTDSIVPRLDPITRMQMDEWSNTVFEMMNPNFRGNVSNQVRLEQAREKILSLVYLKEYIPELVTEEIFNSEMTEIIQEEYLQDFFSGKKSKISLKTLITIIRDVRREIPEIFELVQRIFVLVTENVHLLRNNDNYISIVHPSSHVGNIDPFRVTIFILNLQESKKKVKLLVQTSMSSLDPDDASQTLLLDSNSIKLPEVGQRLHLSSSTESIDVLRLVSSILQVGDTMNLQFRPNRFGTHVLNISVEDERGIISGRSIVVSVYRDPTFYIKTMGAKALGYVGAAISFIGIGLGALIGI